ncbi:hypothetical protein DFP72DRAFT_857810 [Ephemerocybe angulata]|uniref:Uncharacterized protein n=1 Tax=Ephemerocybe angulata TaxID=980116 RepID=A0A8H6LUD8_9AGAR|nr:hypothetical protein DFP72DRAFT_857810 [Tulosesus angulatus]
MWSPTFIGPGSDEVALERFTLAFRESSERHTFGQDPFISPLLDLVRRSRCSLLHLSLESLEVDEALFSQLLVSSPSLQCLLFAGVRTSLNFLDSISSITHPAFQRIEIINRGCDPDEGVINRFTKWANCWVKGAGLDDEDVLSRRKEVISALYQHVDSLKDIGGTILLHGGVVPEPMGIEELKEEGWNVDVVYWAPTHSYPCKYYTSDRSPLNISVHLTHSNCREYASIDPGDSVHIPSLLTNVSGCDTPDTLARRPPSFENRTPKP